MKPHRVARIFLALIAIVVALIVWPKDGVCGFDLPPASEAAEEINEVATESSVGSAETDSTVIGIDRPGLSEVERDGRHDRLSGRQATDSFPASAQRRSDNTSHGWSGRVYGPDGQPLAGAELYLHYATFLDSRPSHDQVTKTITDAGGAYFMPWPRKKRWSGNSDMELRCSASDLLSVTAFLPAPDEPATQADIHLLAADGRVHFTVLSGADHSRLAGRDVVMDGENWDWSSHGVTDRDGRVSLAIRSGDLCEVGLGADDMGYLEGPWPLETAPNEELDLTIYYHGPNDELHLLAVETNRSTPVPSARFLGYDWEWESLDRLLPSDGGRLHWKQDAGQHFWFHALVEAEGFLPTRVFLNQHISEDLILVPLSRVMEREFLLRILKNGEPMEGAVAEIEVRSGLVSKSSALEPPRFSWEFHGNTLMSSGLSDAQGLVRVKMRTRADRFPGVVEVVLREPGARLVDLGKLNTNALGPMPWEFDMVSQYASVEFRLTDPNRDDLRGERFSIWYLPIDSSPVILRARHQGGQPPHLEGKSADQGSTDPYGILRFKVPAPCRFAWRHAGRRRIDESETLQPGEHRVIEVHVGDWNDLDGVVLNAEGEVWAGSPIPLQLRQPNGEVLEGLDPNDPAGWPTWTHCLWKWNGSFSFSGVPKGEYRIHSPTMPLKDPEGAVFTVGDDSIVLILTELNRLGLEVVDPVDGRPIPGVGHFLLSTSGGIEYSGTLWEGRGETSFPARGAARVLIFHPDFGPTCQTIGSWNTRSDQQKVRIEMGTGRRIEIQISPSLAQPSKGGLTMEIEFHQGPWKIPMIWDELDPFVLPHGPTQAFRMTALDEAGIPIGQRLEVPPGRHALQLHWEVFP